MYVKNFLNFKADMSINNMIYKLKSNLFEISKIIILIILFKSAK